MICIYMAGESGPCQLVSGCHSNHHVQAQRFPDHVQATMRRPDKDPQTAENNRRK